MDARSLFATLAILFLLWLVRAWVKWDSQLRTAEQSRQRIRNRLADATLAERVGKRRGMHVQPSSVSAGVMEPQSASQPDSRNKGQVEVASQWDPELQQLRDEIDRLRSERMESAQRIEALERRVLEQQLELNQADVQGNLELSDSTDVDVRELRHDLAEKERQNAQLKSQLANMSSPSVESRTPSEPDTNGGSVARTDLDKDEARGDIKTNRLSGKSAPKRKPSATRKVLTPLFQAPAETNDLKRIKGIGPVMERTLNELGVTTFRQLAEFTEADIDKVSEAIGAFPGRIERDDWVGKARQFQHESDSA